MIFLGIVFIAIYLYIRGYKISALLLFFFFITSGFNLIPEEITKFGFISKGSDYALLMLVGIIIIDGMFNWNYFNRDNFTNYLIIFASFLIICILYNKFVISLTWGDILRTCRYQFFWIAYFLFRHLKKGTLVTLLKCLFLISLFTAVLFLLQIVIDENILVKTVTSHVEMFGIRITRFYNQPDMLFFFTFMALYNNPLKGIFKYVSIVIFTAALLGAFHRSLIGCFFFSVIIGYVVMLPRIKKMYFITIASFILLFAVVFEGNKFIHSRTYLDVKNVTSGSISTEEIDLENLYKSTFTFRILHLIERNQYLLDNPKTMFFGAGLIPEDSPLIGKMFDFKIGLIAELTESTIQVDTGDISYSVLILRLGYIGTVLYLLLIIYLMVFFYKKRDDRYALFSFLYFILTIGVSFFSANLLNPVTYILPLISYSIIKKTDAENAASEKLTNGKE